MVAISVVMSVYNTKEEWLRESIESILNQTFGDFEFIIINDGSTNNAEDVILSYKDERIKYIKQENQGLAKSLNTGLNIAKGEYIARMDSDDISLPERFEKQVKFLDKNKDISILGTWFERFPQKEIIKHPSNIKYLDLLQRCYIGHPTVMFRRAEFEKYNLKYNPEYLCEDYELWSRAISYFRIANLPEILLKYRWSGENLSKPTKEFISSTIKVQENMLNFLTNNKKEQDEIMDTINHTYSWLERIFSIKNSRDRKYKVIMILGKKIKIKINKKHYNLEYKLGEKSQVCDGSYIDSKSIIGNYTYIGRNCNITKAVIGNYCSIGNNVTIVPGEHDIYSISTSHALYDGNWYKKLTEKDCIIKNDVWIGADSIIRRGITVGNGAVIGANSFVNKDVPDFAVVAGNPAKIIKYRFDVDKCNKIAKSKWWNFKLDKAKTIIKCLEE